MVGYIRGVGEHCEPVAEGRKVARLNPQLSLNALFLYPSFGPFSTNIPRTSFLIIYALQLLSISNHTFIFAKNTLPRSCLQEDFSWSAFSPKPLFLRTLPIVPHENIFLRKWAVYRAKWTSCPKAQNNNPLVTRDLIFKWLDTQIMDIK